MFYQRPKPDYNPLAYDPPFTPRYSVPESFRRALSYEGQQHWFMQLYEELYGKSQSLRSIVVADTETPDVPTGHAAGDSEFAYLVGKTEEFKVTWPDGVEPVESIEDGDVVALRFTDPEHEAMCVIVGYLVDACRCITPERWNVHVMYIVHDLTVKLDEVTARVTALESKVKDHETRLTTVETKVKDHETRITAVEGKVTNLTTEVTNLKNTVNNLPTQADLTEVKQRLTTLESNYTTLKTQVDAVEAAVNNRKVTLQDILNKINGGGTIGSDGHITWGDTVGKIPTGNMNVYGGDSNYIRTRTGTVSSGSDNDVRVV